MKNQYSTKGNKISFGRFDDIVPEIEKLQAYSPSVRRISYNSIKKLADPNSIKPTLIATDGKRIYFEQCWHDARDILLKINQKTRRDIFVLTKKEKYQLVELEVETGAKIYAFEKNFPFLQDAAVFPDPEKRIKHMERGFSWLKKEGIEEKSLGRHTSKKNLYLIARKVRFKSTLDHWFAFTSQSSIQEVFKAHESRDERVIVALDYNSMYPSCMNGSFPDPRHLKYISFRNKESSLGNLNHGIYRVILKCCTSKFFMEHHPFKFFKSNKSFTFKLGRHDSIETILHRDELISYSKYFSEVTVIEGIESKESIHHPLLPRAKRLYSEKLNLKNQGESQKKSYRLNFISHELQTLYSASSLKKYKKFSFGSYQELSEKIKELLLIDVSEFPDLESVKKLLSSKYIRTSEHNGKLYSSIIDFMSDQNVHSLSSQVVSNARIKVLKLMEHTLRLDGAEICYANTDSLHVSVEKNKLDEFFDHLAPYISEKMGDLKVQCVAEEGFWFDTGRYWLKNGDSTALFKNKTFNKKNNKNIYKKHVDTKRVHHAQAFSYVKKTSLLMENSFSFSKRVSPEKGLDHAYMERYNFDEIENLIVAGETYENEKALSREWLINLFNRAATN